MHAPENDAPHHGFTKQLHKTILTQQHSYFFLLLLLLFGWQELNNHIIYLP
jgi:hypothetical protein